MNMKLSLVVCCVLAVSGCAGLSNLTETALPIIERFPFGHVLDAAKEVKDALTTKPVPVPDVTK